jgi:hypothetical protein
LALPSPSDLYWRIFLAISCVPIVMVFASPDRGTGSQQKVWLKKTEAQLAVAPLGLAAWNPLL